MVFEMLYHDLGFLRNVVRMESHESRQRLRCLLALDIGVVLARLEQAVNYMRM